MDEDQATSVLIEKTCHRRRVGSIRIQKTCHASLSYIHIYRGELLLLPETVEWARYQTLNSIDQLININYFYLFLSRLSASEWESHSPMLSYFHIM